MTQIFGAVISVLAVLAACGQSPPFHKALSSVDGRYTIKILQTALPGSDPVDGFFTLAVCDGNQTLSRFPTEGYLLSAFWSPDGKYVAVNNRRANSGDYLWVFSLEDGKALKAPDEIPGEVFADRATRKFPKISLKNFKKYFNVAKGWIDRGELEVHSRLVFDGLKDSIILRRATYRVSRSELIPSREDFEIIKSSAVK